MRRGGVKEEQDKEDEEEEGVEVDAETETHDRSGRRRGHMTGVEGHKAFTWQEWKETR